MVMYPVTLWWLQVELRCPLINRSVMESPVNHMTDCEAPLTVRRGLYGRSKLVCSAFIAGSSLGKHRRDFDLEFRARLDKTRHLQRGHHREIPADHLAVDRA